MTRLLLIASLILFTNCGDSDDDTTTTDNRIPEFSVKPLKGTGLDIDATSDLLAASDGVSCTDQKALYHAKGSITASELAKLNAADNNPEVFVTSIYAVGMHFDCMVRAMFDDATPDSTGDVVEYKKTGDNEYFVAWNKDATKDVTDGRLVVKDVSGDVTTEIVVTLSHDASNDTKTLKGVISTQVGTGKTWSGAYIFAFKDNTGDMNHYAGVRVFDGTNVSLVGAHMIEAKGASMFTQQCKNLTDENTSCSMIDSADDTTTDAKMKAVYFDEKGEPKDPTADAGTGLFALNGEGLVKWLGDHVDINPLYKDGDEGLLDTTDIDLFEAKYSKPKP